MAEQGGGVAGRQGKVLENQVEQQLLHLGYTKLTDSEKKTFIRQNGVSYVGGDKWFCTQVQFGKNIYGSRWKLDFYLYNAETFPNGLVIECKWQQSQGSVDEKYVFTVMSLIGLKRPVALLLAGEGARPITREWIRSIADKRSNDLQFFASSDEFTTWANKNL